MVVVWVLLAFTVPAGCLVSIGLLRVPQVDVDATRTAGEELARGPRIRRFLRSRVRAGVATRLALTAAALATVVGGTVIGVLAYVVRRRRGVGWNLPVADWAGSRASSSGTRVLDLVTGLGMRVTVVIVSVAAAIYGYRRWRRASVVIFLVLVVGGQSLIANLIKVAVERARPDVHPLASFSGSSFPSGHSTAAAATFAAIALVLGRGRSARVRAVLGGVAAGIAVAVACSRVLLGVHRVSDVIAGLALGWTWFAICSAAFGGRILRFAPPEAVAVAPASGPEIRR